MSFETINLELEHHQYICDCTGQTDVGCARAGCFFFSAGGYDLIWA